MADLERARDFIKAENEMTIELLRGLNDLGINRFSQAAAVNAGLNYISLQQGKYPWEILKLEELPPIITSFTISINEPLEMINAIKKSNYPIIKIKLGFPEEIEFLELLQSVTGKLFRIDANGAWTPEKAESMLYYLRKLEVHIVEQPTAVQDIKEWRYLKKRSGFKGVMIVDEGLESLADYYEYCDHVDGINIKMSKSGGVLNAVEIAQQARKDKLKVMLGCMIESSIGIVPSIYISSLADYFDLDSPLLLKYDPGNGIIYENEKLTLIDDIIGGPKPKKTVDSTL